MLAVIDLSLTRLRCPSPSEQAASTPDQFPLSRSRSRSRPPRPLDCADVQPRDPVSWCSVVAQGKDNGSKASGMYLINILFLGFFLILDNIRLKFARARASKRRQCGHAFHRGNTPYGTADCTYISREWDNVMRKRRTGHSQRVLASNRFCMCGSKSVGPPVGLSGSGT